MAIAMAEGQWGVQTLASKADSNEPYKLFTTTYILNINSEYGEGWDLSQKGLTLQKR